VIRTVLVDDESLALARLRRLLEAEPDVAIVAECTSGREAIDAVTACRPDLVFLDVQMPEIDGFEVLRAISPDNAPCIVFVTAYDAHAVRAFQVRAVDYLLKPIDGERVQQAVARVRQTREQATAAQRYAALQEILDDLKTAAKRLLVRDGGRTKPIRVDEIDWIDAVGNYARLHVSGQTHMLRTTLRTLEDRLGPAHFCRVHRSALINLDRVTEVQAWASGDSVVILSDGARLRVSRRYRVELERRLGQSV
jgi:two-component system LytT family response regulator